MEEMINEYEQIKLRSSSPTYHVVTSDGSSQHIINNNTSVKQHKHFPHIFSAGSIEEMIRENEEVHYEDHIPPAKKYSLFQRQETIDDNTPPPSSPKTPPVIAENPSATPPKYDGRAFPSDLSYPRFAKQSPERSRAQLKYQSKSFDIGEHVERDQKNIHSTELSCNMTKSTSLPGNSSDVTEPGPFFPSAVDALKERNRMLQRYERMQISSSPSSPQMTYPMDRHHPVISSPSDVYKMYTRTAESPDTARALSRGRLPHPYDRMEKHMRRILSEEQNNIEKIYSPLKKSEGLRRASSFDNFRQFNKHNQPINSSTQIIYPDQYPDIGDYKHNFLESMRHGNEMTSYKNQEAIRHSNDVMSQQNSPLMRNTNAAQRRRATMRKSASEDDGHYYSPANNKNFHRSFDSSDIRSRVLTDIKNKGGQSDGLQEIGPYSYDPTIDDDIAVSVTGLLTLPGSNEKRYPITVGELRRRIAPPEFLNKVDMISYVRLAKTSARELLEKHAIRPKHHSRKSKHSVLSKMCEAECRELNNGVRMLSEAYFPRDWLAVRSIEVTCQASNQSQRSIEQPKHSISQSEQQEKISREFVERKKRIEITRSVLKQFADLLETCQPREEIQNYALATHAFGMTDILNNIDLLDKYFQTESDMLCDRLNAVVIAETTTQMDVVGSTPDR